MSCACARPCVRVRERCRAPRRGSLLTPLGALPSPPHFSAFPDFWPLWVRAAPGRDPKAQTPAQSELEVRAADLGASDRKPPLSPPSLGARKGILTDHEVSTEAARDLRPQGLYNLPTLPLLAVPKGAEPRGGSPWLGELEPSLSDSSPPPPLCPASGKLRVLREGPVTMEIERWGRRGWGRNGRGQRGEAWLGPNPRDFPRKDGQEFLKTETKYGRSQTAGRDRQFVTR